MSVSHSCDMHLLEEPEEADESWSGGGGGGGAGGVRQDEIEDGGRNQSTEKEREREKLLDRLLLIRGCLAPYHYVRRNPFSFAQICLEFFLFSLASIIRAGNQISL